MKIALRNTLYPPLGIGGSERSVNFLAEALVKRGHEVHVVSQGEHWRTRYETVNGVRIVRVGSPPGYGPNVYAHKSLARQITARALQYWKPDRTKLFFDELKRIEPDVVNTNVIGQPHSLWEMLRKQNMVVVHTLRNHSLICPNRMFVEGRNCETQCAEC